VRIHNRLNHLPLLSLCHSVKAARRARKILTVDVGTELFRSSLDHKILRIVIRSGLASSEPSYLDTASVVWNISLPRILRSAWPKSALRLRSLTSERDDHCLSGGPVAVCSAFVIPLCQTTVGVKPEKAPRQLDHGTTHPHVTSSRKTFLTPVTPLSSGDPVKAAWRATALLSRRLRDKTSCTSVSAVSIPMPKMRAIKYTIAFVRVVGSSLRGMTRLSPSIGFAL